MRICLSKYHSSLRVSDIPALQRIKDKEQQGWCKDGGEHFSGALKDIYL